jgi:hypothetical protein
VAGPCCERAMLRGRRGTSCLYGAVTSVCAAVPRAARLQGRGRNVAAVQSLQRSAPWRATWQQRAALRLRTASAQRVRAAPRPACAVMQREPCAVASGACCFALQHALCGGGTNVAVAVLNRRAARRGCSLLYCVACD